MEGGSNIKPKSIIGADNGNRAEDDFYPTPPFATIELLKRETFVGSIWECACGDGAISEVLKANGYTNVFSSDLIDRGYGAVNIDYLTADYKFNNIITNPPYRYAQQFVEKALKDTNKKVAMLLKIQFLESASRYKLFQENPPKKIYVFSKRLTLYQNGVPCKNSGLMCFAWFVWEKDYRGATVVDWIL